MLGEVKEDMIFAKEADKKLKKKDKLGEEKEKVNYEKKLTEKAKLGEETKMVNSKKKLTEKAKLGEVKKKIYGKKIRKRKRRNILKNEFTDKKYKVFQGC